MKVPGCLEPSREPHVIGLVGRRLRKGDMRAIPRAISRPVRHGAFLARGARRVSSLARRLSRCIKNLVLSKVGSASAYVSPRRGPRFFIASSLTPSRDLFSPAALEIKSLSSPSLALPFLLVCESVSLCRFTVVVTASSRVGRLFLGSSSPSGGESWICSWLF